MSQILKKQPRCSVTKRIYKTRQLKRNEITDSMKKFEFLSRTEIITNLNFSQTFVIFNITKTFKKPSKEFIFSNVTDLQPAILTKKEFICSYFSRIWMFFRNTCFKERISVIASVGRENVLA